jgi:hypothetical protein
MLKSKAAHFLLVGGVALLALVHRETYRAREAIHNDAALFSGQSELILGANVEGARVDYSRKLSLPPPAHCWCSAGELQNEKCDWFIPRDTLIHRPEEIPGQSPPCIVFAEEKEAPQGDTEPLFSIIVSVYNQQEVVGKSIQSILELTRESFELIVVVDGCTDESEKRVLEAILQFQCWDTVRSQPEQTICRAGTHYDERCFPSVPGMQ